MATITDETDRDALLRYADLKFALADLVNKYLDLPMGTVHEALLGAAHDLAASAYLPKKFQPQQPLPTTEQERET